MSFAKILASAAFIALAKGHVIMANPAPFTSPAVDNSPLDDSNFPCKATTGATYSGTATQMALGSNQSLSFIGSAVHGGGSCQVSISYDTAPTKQSDWKVIHSIQGGCPARGQDGNFAEDPNFQNPNEYEFTIPSDLPAGKATLAWTWLNVIGNREFYMNCAPIEITGSGGDQSAYEKLPNMFVANLPSINQCATTEKENPLFPDPGTSVENNEGTYPLVELDCDGGVGYGSGSSGGSDSGSGSGSDAGTSSAVASAPASTASVPGGVFITVTGVAGSATAAPTTAVASSPATSPATSPTATASASAGSGTGSGSSAVAQTGACTVEGEYNCLNSSFQQCASGQWSVVMPMAAGTVCTPGQSATLDMKAS
ncbi:uncharacterized protein BCR38DRAFT_307598, partial [Pseudomassariella vexata]